MLEILQSIASEPLALIWFILTIIIIVTLMPVYGYLFIKKYKSKKGVRND